MLVGPVFTRELVTAPRRTRLYVLRAVYAAAMLVLMSTAWLVLAGTQVVRNVGDLARFGGIVFQILAPLQLALAVFFSALSAASAVAQEKDRRTLDLLLMTRLSDSELVLGKLLAALLNVLVLLAAGLPLLVLTMLFGGVALEQVLRVALVTMASAWVAGSLGSTLALWRDKTFQSLALTALLIMFWMGTCEAIYAGAFGLEPLGMACQKLGAILSPWRAVLAACEPYIQAQAGEGWTDNPATVFAALAFGLAAALNLWAVVRVRVWNPTREARPQQDDYEGRESSFAAEPAAANAMATPAQPNLTDQHSKKHPPHRRVWDNPILWRETQTLAYGRRMLVIRLAYLALAALAGVAVHQMIYSPAGLSRNAAAGALAPLCVLSLVLVNAQAVTSLTTERDGRALDLLLVTDLTPPEFIYGKLGGIFYNTKEMILAPLLLCGYLWWCELLSLENLLYLWGGLAVLYCFAAMLGLHAGMHYENSRSAIGVSLGTVFFLFLGIATCLRIMVAFSGSFQVQLQPFLAFMLGGGVGLYVALGARTPSAAIAVASLLCPFATFYAITSFLLDYTLGVFLVTAGMYGFATAAMLMPAIYEFDVATGRTTVEE